jgi:hypothetical protein
MSAKLPENSYAFASYQAKVLEAYARIVKKHRKISLPQARERAFAAVLDSSTVSRWFREGAHPTFAADMLWSERGGV